MIKGTDSFNETARQIDEFARDVRSLLYNKAHDALDLIGIIAQSDFWITPGGEGAPVNPTKLTVRSGRAFRSLGPMGGAFGGTGSREGFHDVKLTGDSVVATKGSRVPYLNIHEKGGTIHQTVTEKQRKFFWAMAYKYDDDKFKAMALSKTLDITIPARPSLTPAGDKARPQIEKMFKEAIEELASGRF